MEPWTLEELEECRNGVYPTVRTAENVRQLWTKYGGVPRYVLGHRTADPEDLVREAIARSSVVLVSQTLLGESPQPHVSDVLLHLWKGETGGLRLDWASPWVAEQVADRAWRLEKQRLLEFLAVSSELPVLGTLRGNLWEGLCHSRIAKGGRFRVRDLAASADSQVEELTLAPCPSTVMFDSLGQVTTAEAGTYCRPRSRRFPAVDSLKQPNMIFQITVAQKHPINRSGLEQAVGCLRSQTVDLFFVVPESNFLAFQKQRLVGETSMGMEMSRVIHQYALEMTYS
jgi:hypothetical protein